MRVALTNEITKTQAKPVGPSTLTSSSHPSGYTSDSKTISFGTDSDPATAKAYGYGIAADYVIPDNSESHPLTVMSRA